jgi:hypothetical protein
MYRGLCSGVLKGRSVEAIFFGYPLLLQLWCHEQFTIGRPAKPLHAYEPLQKGHDPLDRFMMGLVWCHRMVISYLSLLICLSVLSSLFNPHLGFSFSFRECRKLV